MLGQNLPCPMCCIYVGLHTPSSLNNCDPCSLMVQHLKIVGGDVMSLLIASRRPFLGQMDAGVCGRADKVLHLLFFGRVNSMLRQQRHGTPPKRGVIPVCLHCSFSSQNRLEEEDIKERG